MRAHRPPSRERGLHLVAWSMMGAVALFVGVTASLVPVLVWSMTPPDRNGTDLQLHLAAQTLDAPLGLLALAGALAVTASLVVFGVAATLLRSPQPDTVAVPLEHR